MNRYLSRLLFTGVAFLGLILAACGPLPPGAVVHVSADGQSEKVEFTGEVDSISTGQWVIDGHIVLIDAHTVISGDVSTGQAVHTVVTVSRDGTITADSLAPAAGVMIGNFQKVNWSGVEDNETATPAPGGSPSSTIPPEKQVHGVGELELVGTVDSISATQWVIAGLTFLIDTRTHIEGTFSAGDMVHVHARVDPDGSYTAVNIGPAGENGKTHGSLEFGGIVQSIAASQWTVGGLTLLIAGQTRLLGSPAVGDEVKVEASINPDGSLTARVIQSGDHFKFGDQFPPRGTFEDEFGAATPQIRTPEGGSGGEYNPQGNPSFQLPPFLQGTPSPHGHHGGGHDGSH